MMQPNTRRGFTQEVANNNCHSRVSLSGISTMLAWQKADPRHKPSGMTTNGFTLIELLVVVLIIGILAAVAVPQYQKAVIKSRYATIKSLVHAIANAREVFYLANGYYSSSFNDLDVDTPSNWNIPENVAEGEDTREFSWGSCHLDEGGTNCNIPTPTSYLEYQTWPLHTESVPNETYNGKSACVAGNIDLTSIENKICAIETKRITPSYKGSRHVVWLY